MSGLLRVFDPNSADDETRRLSRLAEGCWSPLAIVYDPLKAGSIDSTDTIPHDKGVVRAQNADFTPSKLIKGRPECTVFVGNLSGQTTERSLRVEFSRYGRVVKATVIEDIITGRSRGYGFVEYSLEGEANKAYELAHRVNLDGNKIIVDMECGRLLPGWVPRRLGGGFNGRKESGQLRFGCRERPFRKPIKLLSETEIHRVFEDTMGRKLGMQHIEGTEKSGEKKQAPGIGELGKSEVKLKEELLITTKKTNYEKEDEDKTLESTRQRLSRDREGSWGEEKKKNKEKRRRSRSRSSDISHERRRHKRKKDSSRTKD